MSMEEKHSRRKFLQIAAVSAGGVAVLCCGGAYFATRAPEAGQPVVSISSSGKDEDKRYLVAYATKAGSTAGVASAIGKQFTDMGAAVDVMPIADVEDVSLYAGMVIGSCIRAGSWLPEAVSFVEDHKAVLSGIPVAYFSCGMTLANGDTEENRLKMIESVAAARAVVEPQAVGLFAGVYDRKTVSFLENLILKALKTPVGDFRDWEKIGQWTDEQAALMLAS